MLSVFGALVGCGWAFPQPQLCNEALLTFSGCSDIRYSGQYAIYPGAHLVFSPCLSAVEVDKRTKVINEASSEDCGRRQSCVLGYLGTCAAAAIGGVGYGFEASRCLGLSCGRYRYGSCDAIRRVIV